MYVFGHMVCGCLCLCTALWDRKPIPSYMTSTHTLPHFLPQMHVHSSDNINSLKLTFYAIILYTI